MFNDPFFSEKIITSVYAAPLLVAAGFDFWTYRIPNVVTGTLAALYFPCALVWGYDINWLSHAGACALVLAVGLGSFRFGILGGGDVKLLAAVALWLGFTQALLVFVLAVALFGGALALLLLVLRGGLALHAIPLAGYVPTALQPRAPIPYGVAVAAGGLWVISSVPFLLS